MLLTRCLGNLPLANVDGGSDYDAGEHRDQGVDAEYVNPSSAKVADARLRDSQLFGGLLLGEARSLDVFGENNHQSRSNPKILRFLRPETQITKTFLEGRRVMIPALSFP